jgi:SAM-dependent methyltransferase
MKRQLLIGAGRLQTKRMGVEGDDQWGDLVTLDNDPRTGANVIHDLDDLPYLHFVESEFDEIHAYEVLEHCGAQGDWRFFFAQFDEFWRILKPGGLFFASVPNARSVWAWADPGHRRVILPETLSFLSREWSATAVVDSCASDYRAAFRGDWKIEAGDNSHEHQFRFILRALR